MTIRGMKKQARWIEKLNFLVLGVSLAGTISASALERIQLRPRCDSLSVTYASGSSTSVPMLNLPYKEEYDRIEGAINPLTGEEVPPIIFYRTRDGGPKANLRSAIYTANNAYALRIGGIQTAFIIGVDSDAATYVARRVVCILRFPPFLNVTTDKKRGQCYDNALNLLINDVDGRTKTRDDDLTDAVIDTDDEIVDFIGLYRGCDALDAEIRLWERYWAHLQ
jgi:hypothetical protein